MILDYNYSKNKKNLSVSYITNTGGKKILNFNVNKFKAYYSTPNGNYTNWDGSKCDIRWTENPGKFDILTYLTEMNDEYKQLLKGKVNPKIYTFDIETKINENKDFPDPLFAREEITNISIVSPDLNCIVLGTRPLDEGGLEYVKNSFNKYIQDVKFFHTLNLPTPYIKYMVFDNEEKMLEYFLHICSQVPILSGWNCILFDWNYITHRIRNYYPNLSIVLSSCTRSLVNKRFTNAKGEKIDLPMPQHTLIIDMMDVMDMDMMVMPIKESKTLEYISSETPGLGIHKIDYDGDLQDLYESDYPRYVFYNAIDSILVQLINYRYKTLNNVFIQALYAGTKIQDCFSKIAISEVLVFNDFYEHNLKVVDDGVYNEPERGKLMGAYVKIPIPGIHNYVCCNDFASLYPSSIRTCNLSFENFVGVFYDEEKLKPYKDQPKKYIVIGPHVYDIKKGSEDRAGQLLYTFMDEEKLKPYREDPNYFVSVNGSVYKNDKDYSFRRIEAKLKAARDADKYLAKQLDAQVISDVDHLHNNTLYEYRIYNDKMIECMKELGYTITNSDDLKKLPDINEFERALKVEITFRQSKEQAMKILMNSMYGGSSHIKFFWFNMYLANDITGESRNLTHMMEHHISQFWKDNWLKMTDLHKKLNIEIDPIEAQKALNECPLVSEEQDPDAFHEKSFVYAAYGDTDSLYLSYNPLMHSIKGFDKMTIEQKRDILVRLNTEFMDEHNKEFIDAYYASRHGRSVHNFELEIVISSGVWLDVKKRYAGLLLWKDGKSYDIDNLPMKIKGMEMIKSMYPKQAREGLKRTIRYLLENSDDKYIVQKLNLKVQEEKNKFYNADIEDICLNQKVNNYTKYVLSDDGPSGAVFAKKATHGVKALGNYNWIRNHYKLQGDPIYSGKVKMYVVKDTTNKKDETMFAYTSQHYPKWADVYAPVDKGIMFEKTFLDPLNRIIEEGVKLPHLNADGYIQMSLF